MTITYFKLYCNVLPKKDRSPTFIYSSPIGVRSFYSVFWLLSTIHVYFNAQISLIIGWINGGMLSDSSFVRVYTGIIFGKYGLIFIAKSLTLTGIFCSPQIEESEIFDRFFSYSLRSARKIVSSVCSIFVPNTLRLNARKEKSDLKNKLVFIYINFM